VTRQVLHPSDGLAVLFHGETVMADDRAGDAVERSRQVRKGVAATLEKMRRGAKEDAGARAGTPPAPGPEPRAGRGLPGALLPDVSAVVERARVVIERTRRVLDDTARHIKGREETRKERDRRDDAP
jgi:hypothetical protein